MKHPALYMFITLSMFTMAMAGVVLKNPALNPITVLTISKGSAVSLVVKGKPKASIVIAQEAMTDHTRIEWKAACEFALHVKLTTGAQLPIVSDATTPDGTLVLIGASRLTREYDITAQDVLPEGFRVKSFRQGIAIVGWMPAKGAIGNKGTLFGVYDFLERFLGIRWYYPGSDGTVIPRRSDVVLPPMHYTDAPVRIKRTMYGGWYTPGFAAVEDCLELASRYREGESTLVSTACHTPHNFDMHFDEAPECFEKGLDGKRIKTMPCYGNPKTVELMIRDLENYYQHGITTPWLHPIKDGSIWNPPTETTIHISPPDKAVECSCEYCRPLMNAQASGFGRASKVMGIFVANMAAEIKKRWPEKKVFFLPYANYTEPPKGVTFSDNVEVMIALMKGAGNQKEPSIAQYHDDLISSWAKMTGGKVHLWEYLCWPGEDTSLPFQYPHVLQAFQQRHRHDLIGTFVNGPAGPPSLSGRHWAFQTPTLYCWFRLMWNPDFNVDAALKEYTDLMYGPAKKPMGDILQLLTERWERIKWSTPPTGHLITPRQIHEETMPRKDALRLKSLIAKARSLAPKQSVYRRRVDFFGTAIDIFVRESDAYYGKVNLPVLQILKVGANPMIDGKLDDPCWRDAPTQPFKKAFDRTRQPDQGATVQAVWTATGITYGFTMREPRMDQLVATYTQHDQNVFLDDSIELFLDVEGKRANYYQIVANANGTIFDYCHSGDWDTTGTKAIAYRGENYWSLEVYIPYADFGTLPPPSTGAIWYGNFCRTRLAGGEHELQRWSTLERWNNHDFTAFGQLKFVE